MIQWRLFTAALRFVTRGSDPPAAAARYVPLAGLLVGAAAAVIYWLSAQLWPASVAVVLSMLAAALLPIAKPRNAAGLLRVFALLVKYNALMALSSAELPFAVPENLGLGLIMMAGFAASGALVVSIMASDPPAVPRISAADLAAALVLGLVPAALLGIPGLFGLAAAIVMRLALSAPLFRRAEFSSADRLDITQQTTEICFYLGALATWKYV